MPDPGLGPGRDSRRPVRSGHRPLGSHDDQRRGRTFWLRPGSTRDVATEGRTLRCVCVRYAAGTMRDGASLRERCGCGRRVDRVVPVWAEPRSSGARCVAVVCVELPHAAHAMAQAGYYGGLAASACNRHATKSRKRLPVLTGAPRLSNVLHIVNFLFTQYGNNAEVERRSCLFVVGEGINEAAAEGLLLQLLEQKGPVRGFFIPGRCGNRIECGTSLPGRYLGTPET